MPSKAALKYEPLRLFLADFDASEWATTFTELEEILQDQLPPSARKPRNYQAWWGNDASHVQARAWLDAGWSKDGVDLGTERVMFVRVDSGHREHGVTEAPTPWGRAENFDAPRPSAKSSDVVCFLGYEFVHAAAIEPVRGRDGAPLEFMPQSRYAHAETTRLNRYGEGPFCRFDVRGLPPASGVYAVTVDDGLAYVGIAVDLARRWGPMGYANISPRNCFVGGQSANCKLNQYILLAAREGQRVELWIHEDPDPAPIETSLIRRLNPPWNGHRPRPDAVGEATAAPVSKRRQSAEPGQAASAGSPTTQSSNGRGCLTALFVIGLARLLRLLH